MDDRAVAVGGRVVRGAARHRVESLEEVGGPFARKKESELSRADVHLHIMRATGRERISEAERVRRDPSLMLLGPTAHMSATYAPRGEFKDFVLEGSLDGEFPAGRQGERARAISSALLENDAARNDSLREERRV